MALGGPCAGPAAGMPGAQAHWPGRRRHGCRRSPRTRRIARSRRSATRRPHRADPARRRRAARPRPARRTGAVVLASAECCALGQEPLPDPLQGQGLLAAGPAPVQHVGGQTEEDLAREDVVAGMQGREFGHELGEVSVAGQSVKHDPPGGGRVLGRGQLPHWQAYLHRRHNRHSPAALARPARARLIVAGRHRAGARPPGL